MLADVGERFLNDVEDLDLAPDGQLQIGNTVCEFERDPGAIEEALARLPQRVQQSLRIHPAAEVGDQLAQAAVRVGERDVDVAPVLERPHMVTLPDGVAQQAHPHPHVGEPLRQRIVDLVRHHLALVGETRPQVLALAAVVLDASGDQVGCRLDHRQRRGGEIAWNGKPEIDGPDGPALCPQRDGDHVPACPTREVGRKPIVAPAPPVDDAFAAGPACLGTTAAQKRDGADGRLGGFPGQPDHRGQFQDGGFGCNRAHYCRRRPRHADNGLEHRGVW